MKRMILPLLFAYAAASVTDAGTAFAAYAGKVEGIRLGASQPVYSYVDGAVLKDGAALSEGSGESERVKRVALFYLCLDRDPFFLNPGTEMASIDGTLARISVLEAGMMSASSSTEKLYPVDFLAAYAAASRSYARFFLSPSEDGAAQLLKTIKRGVEAYTADADKISASVLKLYALREGMESPSAGPPARGSHKVRGGLFDKPAITRDFKLIKSNGAAAAKKLAELTKCLETASAYCRPGWPALREPSAQERSEVSLLKPEQIGLTGKKVSGPYLVHAPCLQGEKDNYYYYIERCLEDGLCLNWDYRAAGMLFYPLPEKDPLHKEGLRLRALNGSDLSYCGNKEYLSALHSLSEFEKIYSSSVFERADTAALPVPAAAKIEAAEKAEAAFFGEKIKSQSTLENLGRAYLETLKEVDGLTVPFKKELKNRARLINLGADGLESALASVAYQSRDPKGTAARMGQLLNKGGVFGGMFYTRSYYLLLFMPYSSTVWLLEEKPALLPGMNHKGKTGLRYEEAVKLYGQEEVDKAVKYYSRTQGIRERAPLK